MARPTHPCILGLCLLVLAASPAAAEVVTVKADYDTYIDKHAPGSSHDYDDLVYWDQKMLYVGAFYDIQKALIHFPKDLLPDPTVSAVSAATLKVKKMGTVLINGTCATVQVRRIDGPWTEQATWNAAPAIGGVVYDSMTVDPNQAVHSYDVTALVQEILSEAPEDPWYGVALTPSGYNGGRTVSYVCVEESASDRPRIEIEVCSLLDPDEDGVSECDGDCGPGDGTIYPDAPELCDALDNDCDGEIDEVADGDGDGFDLCADCDDADPYVLPGGTEYCNGVDDDCDGEVDEGFDGDGDGIAPCGATPDCDDGDVAVAPGLVEVCDGKDNDCNGLVDDVEDGDGDGWDACDDCADDDPAIFPGAAERTGTETAGMPVTTARTTIPRSSPARPRSATASTTTAPAPRTSPSTPTRTARRSATIPRTATTGTSSSSPARRSSATARTTTAPAPWTTTRTTTKTAGPPAAGTAMTGRRTSTPRWTRSATAWTTTATAPRTTSRTATSMA